MQAMREPRKAWQTGGAEALNLPCMPDSSNDRRTGRINHAGPDARLSVDAAAMKVTVLICGALALVSTPAGASRLLSQSTNGMSRICSYETDRQARRPGARAVTAVSVPIGEPCPTVL